MSVYTRAGLAATVTSFVCPTSFVCKVLATPDARATDDNDGANVESGGQSPAEVHAANGPGPVVYFPSQPFGGRLRRFFGPPQEPGSLTGPDDALRGTSPNVGGPTPAHSGEGDVDPWALQRAAEERKLNERLGFADELDGVAERSGLANLHNIAAWQREKAKERYDRRLATINDRDPNYVSPRVGDRIESDRRLTHDSGPLHDADREIARNRQLRHEERTLAQRMEAAEWLWKTYEQTGDKAIAEAARGLEERALAQFESRIEAITDSQRRQVRSDPSDELPEVVEAVKDTGTERSVLVDSLP